MATTATTQVQEGGVYSWKPSFIKDLSSDMDAKTFVGMPDMSSWQFENYDIQSRWVKGGKVQVNLKAKFDLTPKQLFIALTHPGNCEIFRNNKPGTIRNVISEEEGGTQVVEVIQNMGWRTQHLLVTENERNCSISFKLSKKGFMRIFEGRWTFQRIEDNEQNKSQGTYATLEQFVLTTNFMPGLMRKIVPGISAKHVRHMVEDIQTLQKRIHLGETLDEILEIGMKQHEEEFKLEDEENLEG